MAWAELSSDMQKMCGSFNIPPLMPATSHLHSRFRKVCSPCCQLDEHPKITAVLELLENDV